MTSRGQTTVTAALVTRLDQPDELDKVAMTNLLVQLLMSGARAPGFWSGELIAPVDFNTKEWQLIQHFNSTEEARTFQDSSQYHELWKDFKAKYSGIEVTATHEIKQGAVCGGTVATAILTSVRPENREEYFDWECRIQSAQAKYPGYQGVYLQPPVPDRPNQWTKLLRFDTPENLETWFNSAERLALLAEAEKFISSTKYQKMDNSFPGWFPVDEKTGKGSANWKSAMLVLLGLYPIVALEIWLLQPFETTIEHSIKTCFNLVLSVLFTTFVSMPYFIKVFRWWLLPAEGAEPSVHLKGALIVVALIAVQCWLFSFVL